MMRSLSFKLTMSFLIVGVLGVGLVALLVNWQTAQKFDQYMADLYQDEMLDLTQQLADHYRQYGSWKGINALLILDQSATTTPPPRRWLPVTLVDAQQMVIYGGGRYEIGQQVSRRDLQHGTPVTVNDEIVGWALLSSSNTHGAPAPGTPEDDFLVNVNQATIVSAIGASVMALLLGVVLARTISNPVAELTTATRLVAGGALGYQVTVRGQDELGALAASFNQMSADLAHANHLRQQMTADIAHDLRTPMSVILGYAESLSDGKLQGTPEMYMVLYQESTRLSHLIEDLRTLSLADAGELPLLKRPFPPQALLEHVALAHMVQAEQQGVSLTVIPAPDLRLVSLDPERMIQVLGNLVRNALRFTPAAGSICLQAQQQDGNSVTFSVQDSGRGIAPEDLPHIFNRFYRGDQARPQVDNEADNSGLGLAIASAIVQAHGGKLTAVSALGQGTTMIIELPYQ
ncbi:MAG: HAMP domain-containing protein [Anaerolinea sp.]|nr:HAMP domain-containing protein [Anaerolinea sp.]